MGARPAGLTPECAVDSALKPGQPLANAAALSGGCGGSYEPAAALHKAWWVTLPLVWKE